MEQIDQRDDGKIKIILFIAILVCGIVYFRQKQEIKFLNYQVNDLQDQVYEYQDALSQANENIEEANSKIEEAQSYAWESYEDMGYILENLTTVDTVYVP